MRDERNKKKKKKKTDSARWFRDRGSYLRVSNGLARSTSVCASVLRYNAVLIYIKLVIILRIRIYIPFYLIYIHTVYIHLREKEYGEKKRYYLLHAYMHNWLRWRHTCIYVSLRTYIYVRSYIFIYTYKTEYVYREGESREGPRGPYLLR